MIRILFLALLLPIVAFAQDTTIRFTNSTPVVDVPILNGSTPVIDQDGNIYAQCQLQTGLGVCEGLDTAPAGTPPTLTLARSDGASPVTTDTGITLAWTTGNAPALCYAAASPSDAAWSGAKSVSGGSQAITFSTTGSKTYSLTCYNNSGASPTRSVTVSVQAGSTDPPDPDPTDCDAIGAGDPWYRPSGYTARTVSWSSAFNDTPFFTPTTFMNPLGSFIINNASVATNYISIPFVPQADTSYALSWWEAQTIPVVGYYAGRPAWTAFLTVSKCKGDFRKEDNQSADTSLKRGCRRASQTGQIGWTTEISTSTTSVCAVTPGEQYYLNILFADPNNALPSVSCESGERCEINTKPSFN